MVLKLAQLHIGVDADTTRAHSNLEGLRGEVNRMPGAFDAASSGVGGFINKLGGLGMAVFGIQQLGASVASFASGLVSGNAEFERYNVQFGVLLGSSEAAKQRLEELTKFGAETPFELPEVVRADKILQGFGLHSEEAAKKFGFSGEQIRTIAGDVASGAGASFEELSTYIGKFASGATGDAMMRFTELGIVTRDQLKQMGVQFSKSGELVSPLDEATNALLKAMQQKYGGMMAAQSKTFEGMLSNLSDWIGNTKRKLMEPVFEVLKDNLEKLLTVLNSEQMQVALDRFANGLASIVDWGIKATGALSGLGGDAARGAISLFEQIAAIPQVKTVLDDTKDGLETLRRVVVGLADAARSGGVSGIVEMLDHVAGVSIPPELWKPVAEFADFLGTIPDKLKDIWAALTGGDLGGAAGGVVNLFLGIKGAWQDMALDLGKGAAELFTKLAPQIGAGLTKVGDILMGLAREWIPKLAAGMAQRVNELWTWVQQAGPPLLTALGNLLSQVLAWAKGQIPNLINMLGEWLVAAVKWIADLATQIIPKLLELVTNIVNWLRKEGPPMVEKAFSEWIPAALGWVLQAAWEIVSRLPGILLEIGKWIVTEGIPGIFGLFKDVGDAAIKGIMEALGNLAGKIGEAFEGLWNWITNEGLPKVGEWFGKIGKAILDAILNGIGDLGGAIGGLVGDAFGNLGETIGGWFGGGNDNKQTGGGFVGVYGSGTSYFSGGLAVVGDQGPEVLRLPRGTSITPARESGEILAAGMVPVNIQATIRSREDLEALALRVAQIIRERR